MLLEAIMLSQKLKIKSSIVDTNNHLNRVFLLQLQNLRVDQVKKSYIGLIQGNLIKFLDTKYLPYILMGVGLCSTTLAYSK